MGAKRRLKDTLAALKTRSGKVVILGALLGGPIGMTGYVIAINNIGAAYTAIISAFYPALGAFLSFVLLKEKMDKKQIAALVVALVGVMAMGWHLCRRLRDGQRHPGPRRARFSRSLAGAPRRFSAPGA